MPDFEALIRHQQLKEPKTNQRLKVVNSSDFKKENSQKLGIDNPRILINIFGGFVGSIIGTLSILFLDINGFLPMDLLKIK